MTTVLVHLLWSQDVPENCELFADIPVPYPWVTAKFPLPARQGDSTAEFRALSPQSLLATMLPCDENRGHW